MITKDYLKKLSSIGFSIIPIDENKIPIGKWKDYQNSKRNTDEIELLNCTKYGLVTGFNDLEVIDIDLKVLSTVTEKNVWWDEYLAFLSDNIIDFLDKVVIAKTQKGGYHILYKSKNLIGNTKVAKLEGMTEAIIETRGKGGYVVVYDNFFTKKEYHQIDFITDEERDIIWSISKTYDYKDPKTIELPKKSEYIVKDQVTPWEDYNNKHSVFDIIEDEFTIVRNTQNSYVIKRNGATSPHSGYVFKNTGCLFLFSTGTIYPNEKLLSPFNLYTIRYHQGDYKSSSSELYKKGYGSRIVKEVESIRKEVVLNIEDLIFPLEIYPENIQNYLLECNRTLNSSIDYMGCAFLWVLSVIIGNSIKIQVKTGWIESVNMWLALVGKPGVGKTPNIENVIFPLHKANSLEIKNYIKKLTAFEKYKDLDKKEKERVEEQREPKKTQFIANDITLEALIELHSENQNSIGVFKDELSGWLKDMNKYRAGSDLEFWLSTWSNKGVSLNRRTSKNAFIESPIIPVLGGIQPGILNDFFTAENKDNGFIDRMLTCYPDVKIEEFSDAEMHEDVHEWYNSYVLNFYDKIKKEYILKDSEGDIISHVALLSPEAKKEYIRIDKEITAIQNSDVENEYMKSMLPKQKSYIPRFALMLNILYAHEGSSRSMFIISKESMLSAEKLSKYFINMSKKIKIDSVEVGELKQVISNNKTKSKKDQIKETYNLNPDFNKKELAELLGVSRQSIYNTINELKK
jgi:hypothetical protein